MGVELWKTGSLQPVALPASPITNKAPQMTRTITTDLKLKKYARSQNQELLHDSFWKTSHNSTIYLSKWTTSVYT